MSSTTKNTKIKKRITYKSAYQFYIAAKWKQYKADVNSFEDVRRVIARAINTNKKDKNDIFYVYSQFNKLMSVKFKNLTPTERKPYVRDAIKARQDRANEPGSKNYRPVEATAARIHNVCTAHGKGVCGKRGDGTDIVSTLIKRSDTEMQFGDYFYNTMMRGDCTRSGLLSKRCERKKPKK